MVFSSPGLPKNRGGSACNCIDQNMSQGFGAVNNGGSFIDGVDMSWGLQGINHLIEETFLAFASNLILFAFLSLVL